MRCRQPIRVAVVGVGAFGRQHARVYADLPEAALVAVVDRDGDRAERVAAEFGCDARTSLEGLSAGVQAASVAVPTAQHASVGLALVRQGVDILVEKPLAPDAASAEELAETAAAQGRLLQVGHLERFNPAVEAAAAAATLPLFFEVHRLSPFTPRSLDVDVVLDLMIHDLDVVRSLVDAEAARVDASGMSVVSDRTDIANARIQFRNGCVANLTASRVSTERVRKLRFFQPREYVSIDYIRRRGVRIALDEANRIRARPLAPPDAEPLERQLKSFLACVRERSRPRVSGRDGLETLRLALRIRQAIDEHSQVVARTLAARA